MKSATTLLSAAVQHWDSATVRQCDRLVQSQHLDPNFVFRKKECFRYYVIFKKRFVRLLKEGAKFEFRARTSWGGNMTSK